MGPTITFLTLFLSLVTGPHPVEVAVDGNVAAVELRLDGQVVATRSQAPWSFELDFGAKLRPHDLEAVAFDSSGREVARDRQLVNMPQQVAETRVVVRRRESDRVSVASIAVASALLDEPVGYRATLNGLPVPVVDPSEVELGVLDFDHANILSVEAHFEDGITARTDVTVGGVRGSVVAADLTAVPVEGKKPDRRPHVDDWRGALEFDDGRPLTIEAVERQGVKVYIVRAEEARTPLRKLGERYRPRSRRQRAIGSLFDSDLGPEDNQAVLINAYPELRTDGQQSVEVFNPSPPIALDHRSLGWVLTRTEQRVVPDRPQALADAVAVAGLMASASRCPRAVLLVIADDPVDASHHSPATVRAFLQELQVPLEVWRVSQDPVESEPWGEVVQVGRGAQLNRAAEVLEKRLKKQLVLWATGSFLPGRVRLVAGPNGAVIAGGS